MKYADEQKQFKKLAKISKKLGKYTKTALKIVGKSVFKLVKVTRKTASYFIGMIGVIISTVIGSLYFFLSLAFFAGVRKTVYSIIK